MNLSLLQIGLLIAAGLGVIWWLRSNTAAAPTATNPPAAPPATGSLQTAVAAYQVIAAYLTEDGLADKVWLAIKQAKT